MSPLIMRVLISCMLTILVLVGCTKAPRPSNTTPINPEDFIVDWTQTVDLEHSDRKNRLKRLASNMPNVAPPKYYDYVVPKYKHKSLPVDIPLLRVVFDDRVFFDTDKSELRPEALPIIDLISDSLRREPPDVAVFIAGHTDSRGPEDYNYNLSVDRANVVAKALVNHGIGMSNIWRVGFGEAVPLGSNDTAKGRSMNRRVEFIFSAKLVAAATWLSEQLKAPCSSNSTSGAQSCKRQITKNLKFTALPIKNNQIVAPSSNQSSESVLKPQIGSEETALEIKSKTIPGIKPNGTVVEIESNSPIIIDLDTETFQIPAPNA